MPSTPPLTLPQLEQFATDVAATPHLWQHLVKHSCDIRVYERIWDDEQVNAWLICWSSGQDTGFHDHDQSAAAVAVIAGEVREERLRPASSPLARRFSAGARFTVPAVAIHRVQHAGDSPAITIHAYSPPLARTGSYRIGAAGELERQPLTLEEELRPAVSALV